MQTSIAALKLNKFKSAQRDANSARWL